ncbi:unnamed protein product, partial [Ixodes hexagonus]
WTTGRISGTSPSWTRLLRMALFCLPECGGNNAVLHRRTWRMLHKGLDDDNAKGGASVWRRRGRHHRRRPKGPPTIARHPGAVRGPGPLTASRRTREICGPAYRRCSRSCRLRGTRGRCGPPCRSCSTTSGSGRSPVLRRRRLREIHGCRPSGNRHAFRRRDRQVRLGSLLGCRNRRRRRRSGT